MLNNNYQDKARPDSSKKNGYTIPKKVSSGKKAEIHSFKKVSNFSVFIYKHFKLIIVLEVLSILFAGYLFIIRIELKKIDDYNKLVSWKQEELVKMKEYQNDSLEFEKQYRALEKQVERDINNLYDILPPQKDLPNLMAQIEALVNSHNFVLGSIAMSSEEKSSLNKNSLPLIEKERKIETDLIKEVDINLFVFSEDGGYKRVKELLDALEHHIRFLNVVSFSFEDTMDSYSIILKTYYLNYEEEIN